MRVTIALVTSVLALARCLGAGAAPPDPSAINLPPGQAPSVEALIKSPPRPALTTTAAAGLSPTPRTPAGPSGGRTVATPRPARTTTVAAGLSPAPRAAAVVPARTDALAARSADPAVRRVQGPGTTGTAELPSSPALPGAGLPVGDGAGAGAAPNAGPLEGGQSLSLQAALYGAVTNNPDLVTLRNSNIASAEAVEVARHFPTTLNPTLWVDYRPISLIPQNTFGTTGNTTNGAVGGGVPARPKANTPYYAHGSGFLYISVRQPVELGHQTTHRYRIAQAALCQQQWNVVSAEMLTLVQAYRFFQTAAYRREKLRVAGQLADFNDRLIQTLRRRLEANQVGPADVVLAEVENQATRQQVTVARQDYVNALADLRNQVGIPDSAASTEPFGGFILPRAIPDLDEEGLVAMALQSKPEIHAARAQVAGAQSAVRLARADRFPNPVIGPEYQTDEVRVQYVGLVYITPIPILNNGRPLVMQREADHRRSLAALQQVERRTAVQVRSAASKWNAANRLVNQTTGLTESLRVQVGRLERLFEDNQADLTKLLQARQRLIQLENAELDAVWQATQAQADLLTALGVPGLIAALQATEVAAPATATAATPATPSPSAPAPAVTPIPMPVVRR